MELQRQNLGVDMVRITVSDSPFPWSQLEEYMSVMSAVADLPFKFSLHLHRRLDGFAIYYPRFTHVDPGIEFPLQTVDENLQMEFPHPRDNRLRRFIIKFETQGRVLFHKLYQGQGNSFLIGGGFRLNGLADHRLIEFH